MPRQQNPHIALCYARNLLPCLAPKILTSNLKWSYWLDGSRRTAVWRLASHSSFYAGREYTCSIAYPGSLPVGIAQLRLLTYIEAFGHDRFILQKFGRLPKYLLLRTRLGNSVEFNRSSRPPKYREISSVRRKGVVRRFITSSGLQ